jgi:hypothetical protein
VSYLLAAAAAGFLLFILTPRTDSPHWSLNTYREVGYSTDDQAPDLNRTGGLKDNRDRAFEVVAKNRDGTPKLDLDPNQRWRGASFVEYQGGKWAPQKGFRTAIVATLAAVPRAPSAEAVISQALETAGENGYVLEFDLNGKRKDPVQADPPWWVPRGVCPFCTKNERGSHSWIPLGDGSFYPPTGRVLTKHYRQVMRPPIEPDLSPAFQVVRGNSIPVGLIPVVPRPPEKPNPATEEQRYLATLEPYRFNPLPRVRAWTEKLIDQLVTTGSLSADVVARYSPDDGTFPPADFEVVARAIAGHFASSGEFSYGTENLRHDKTLDPVEDFLLNTKTGSCEWYATALTLCLRSVGLPAQCVLGFKGCESEEDGRYTVRQDHAHAWVEVLIRRPRPDGFVPMTETDVFQNPLPPPTVVWHWLSLDPTPGSDAESKTSSGIVGLWDSVRAWWLAFFNDFVVRYDPERRQRAAATAERWAKNYWREGSAGLFGLSALVAVGLVVRRTRRRVRSASAPVDPAPVWYRRFLAVAAAAGFAPAGGETPGEFADRVAVAVPAAADAAHTLTDALYLVRYAGVAPPVADQLVSAVAAAEAALADAKVAS